MLKSRKFVAFLIAMSIGVALFVVTLVIYPHVLENNIQYFLLYFGSATTTYGGFKALEVSAKSKNNNDYEGK
jgi:hypothetical protein